MELDTIKERWDALLPSLKGVPPDMVETLRRAFYAGAWAMFTMTLDWLTLEPTEAYALRQKWMADFQENGPADAP